MNTRNRIFLSSLAAIVFKLLAFCLLFITPLAPGTTYASDDQVVLVTHKDSTIKSLSKLDIRRIYLGITPATAASVNSPVLNMSDKVIYNDFMKNVMHMTEDGYRRKVIKRVFRRGADYIPEVFTTDQLVNHLGHHKNDISFIRKSEIRENQNIRIIAVLW